MERHNKRWKEKYRENSPHILIKFHIIARWQIKMTNLKFGQIAIPSRNFSKLKELTKSMENKVNQVTASNKIQWKNGKDIYIYIYIYTYI